MKNASLIIILIFVMSILQMCKVESNGQWRSKHSSLELNFSDSWKRIAPSLDTKKETLVGILDDVDNSSFTVKIAGDVPKDRLSDLDYYDSIEQQMLNAHSSNTLLLKDNIVFKEREFKRMIFSMNTEFGEMIHSIYAHRDGQKITGIQFTYPRNLTDNPTKNVPTKMQVLLDGLKL